MKRSVLSLGLFFITALAISQTTVTYNYTGTIDTFIVPANVFLLTVDASGAEGGLNGPTFGGKGGRVQCYLSVNPGDTLFIKVGAIGINSLNQPAGVYNGGGGVYSYSFPSTCGTAGTGGGATDIRFNDTSSVARVIVAGGGGGAGGYVAGNQTYAGGDGGGLVAADGVIWPSWPNSAGKGGTQSAGGAGGVACCSCPTYTTSGSIALGGSGSGDCAGGGGGGGGYYGGGGSCFGGGGGGSSYTGGIASNVTHTQGYRTGDGIVTITYTPSSVGIHSNPRSPVLEVFPNPFTKNIMIKTGPVSAKVVVFDVLGSKMTEFLTVNDQTEYDGSALKPGVYFFEISTTDFRKTIKVVRR